MNASSEHSPKNVKVTYRPGNTRPSSGTRTAKPPARTAKPVRAAKPSARTAKPVRAAKPSARTAKRTKPGYNPMYAQPNPVNMPNHSNQYTSHPKNHTSPHSTGQLRRNQRKRTKKVKRNSGDMAKRFAVFLFSLVILYLLACSYNLFTQENVSFDTIQYGSVDTPKNADGMIIRSEKLYKTSKAGVVSFNVADNDRVRPGATVCTVQDDELIESLENNLEDINKNILELQKSRDSMSLFSDDVKRINSQIKDIIDLDCIELSPDNIDEIYSLKDKVEKKLTTRNQMLLSENAGSLQELANKRLEQENAINQNTLYINANEGGIVSYYVDGLEEAISIDNMSSLSETQTQMKPEGSYDVKTNVIENDTVFKIITDNSWYIASYINTDYIDGWEKDSTIRIYIKDGDETLPFDAEIYILEPMQKKTYVVLKLTKELLNFINKRNITFELNKPQEGYKINNSAIAEETLLQIPAEYVNDGVVIKKTADGTVNVAITNSGGDSDGSYIYTPIEFSTLKIGDVIINPNDPNTSTTLSEVISTKGVYVINTGIAEFKRINEENSTSNSTHTVLDPEKNTNLRLYDRIVTDVKNIKEEQKVY